MGVSDHIEIPEQQKALDSAVEAGFLKDTYVKRIALLGIQRETHPLVTHYKGRFPRAEVKFFDNQAHRNAENWDLNSDWNFEGYDIVACHRTTPYIDDMKSFLKEMKNCIKKNKLVIFDFSIYPSTIKNLDGHMRKVNQYSDYSFGNQPPGDDSCIDFRGDLPEAYKYSGLEVINNCFLTETMTCKNGNEPIKSIDFFKSVGTPIYSSFRISPLKGILTMTSYWLNTNLIYKITDTFSNIKEPDMSDKEIEKIKLEKK